MEAMLAAIRDAIHQEAALQVAGLNGVSLREDVQTAQDGSSATSEETAHEMDTHVPPKTDDATRDDTASSASTSGFENAAPELDDLLAEPLELEALLDESLQDFAEHDPPSTKEELHDPSLPSISPVRAKPATTEDLSAMPEGGKKHPIPKTPNEQRHTGTPSRGTETTLAPKRSRHTAGHSGRSGTKGKIADILSGKVQPVPFDAHVPPSHAKEAAFGIANESASSKAKKWTVISTGLHSRPSDTSVSGQPAHSPNAPRKKSETAQTTPTWGEEDVPRENAPLLNSETTRRARAAFERLRQGGQKADMAKEALSHIDDEVIRTLVLEVLRPLLQDWLNAHLPALVERLVREEIARIARGVEDDLNERS